MNNDNMKKVLLALLSSLAFLPVQAGKIVTDSLYSRTLKETVVFNVYLPDGFEKSKASYPVVYLLHGLSDNYTAWEKRGRMQTVTDELVRSGEIVPTVVIMPNAGGPDVHNTWNGYFNMPGWNYEDFFFGELLPAVEKKYRCGGSKGKRAVMGLSMGGGGSVVYAQRHPDMFSSCYAMSAWLDNKNDELKRTVDEIDKLYYVREAVKEHSALDFLDNADDATIKKLKTVAWFVDCGDDDFLLHLNYEFHMKMKKAGVHSELRVRNGVHNWEYWHLALRLSLPFASRNFDR